MKFMSMKKRGVLAAALLLCASGVATNSVAGVQDLVRETQRSSEAGGHLAMVWWLPVQFWEESLKANPAVTPEMRSQVLGALADYNVIALVRAKPGAAGFSDVQPKAELLKNLRVEAGGKVLEPLAPEQVSPGAQLLLSQLKPMMGAMAGQVGQAMEFVVFPAKAADGTVLLDAMQSGTLKIKFYDDTFSWRLPLGSLMPLKVDKKSGEEFPGNYQFNPFTGDKLAPK
jgi:hypothetical protein